MSLLSLKPVRHCVGYVAKARFDIACEIKAEPIKKGELYNRFRPYFKGDFPICENHSVEIEAFELARKTGKTVFIRHRHLNAGETWPSLTAGTKP